MVYFQQTILFLFKLLFGHVKPYFVHLCFGPLDLSNGVRENNVTCHFIYNDINQQIMMILLKSLRSSRNKVHYIDIANCF